MAFGICVFVLDIPTWLEWPEEEDDDDDDDSQLSLSVNGVKQSCICQGEEAICKCTKYIASKGTSMSGCNAMMNQMHSHTKALTPHLGVYFSCFTDTLNVFRLLPPSLCIHELIDGLSGIRRHRLAVAPLQGKREATAPEDWLHPPLGLSSQPSALSPQLTWPPPCRSTVGDHEENIIAVFHPRLQGTSC